MKIFYTKISVILFFLCLFYSAALFAQTGNEIAGDDKTYPKVNSSPSIDGKITDSEWKD